MIAKLSGELACEKKIVQAIAGAWNEEKNARRFALVKREVSGELKSDEAVELSQLQHANDLHLQQVAPLPWDALQEFHQELLKKSLTSNSG